MKFIAPIKFWLRAIEIFFLQIPCLLIAFYFAGIAGILLSADNKNTLLDAIIFLSIFFLTNTLLFANYSDWGKQNINEKIKFLPSKLGLIDGLKMTIVASITNYSISLLLNFLLPESYLNDLDNLGLKFHFSFRGIILLSVLWLYIASYLFYIESQIKFGKK
ncbi:hypothetical protein VKI21_06980 [Cyanobacterium aponinum UTEX 3222]|uniref:hypothetical protein n=1 Tax=Cyanobacterium aponinum TaxID=379064 RepID=UPI003087ECBB|nr:hypothetical protein VKI21_06980 [Cyanobacterium aponinum UTEX 3222]